VQVLAQQVRQLQDEVEQTRRQGRVAFGYQEVPPPPAPAYASDWAPPVQYAYEAAAPTSAGCDPDWANCGWWWAPALYPTAAVVLRAPKLRRPYPMQAGHRLPAPPLHPGRGHHQG